MLIGIAQAHLAVQSALAREEAAIGQVAVFEIVDIVGFEHAARPEGAVRRDLKPVLGLFRQALFTNDPG